jgi:hypothetical protein
MIDSVFAGSVIVGCVAQYMFLVLYGSTSPWGNPVGRAIFQKSLSIAVWLGIETVGLLLYPLMWDAVIHEHRTFGLFWVAGHVFAAWAAINQLVAFLRQIDTMRGGVKA